MKKFLSVLLSLAMLMSMLVVPVAAEEETAGAGGAVPVQGTYVLGEDTVIADGEEALDATIDGSGDLVGKTATFTVTADEKNFTYDGEEKLVTFHIYAQTDDGTPIQAFSFELAASEGLELAAEVQANNSAFCYAYPAASAELWDSGTYPDSAYSVYQYTADTHYFGAGGVQSGAGVAGERTEVLTIMGKVKDAGTYTQDLTNVVAGNGAAATVEVAAQHTHAFDQQVAEPEYLVSGANCEQAAVYYLSCVCGEPGTETFTYGDALGHDFSAEKAEEQYRVPDTTDQYYKSCIRCGKAGTETFVPSTEGMLQLRIVPQQTTFCPNAADRTVKFDVVIEQNPGVGAFQFMLQFDKSKLKFEKIALTGELEGYSVLGNSNASSAKYGMFSGDADEDITETGRLATLTFTVLDTATDGSTFVIDVDRAATKVGTVDGVPVESVVEQGTLLIAHTYDQEVAADSYLATPATCTKQATYYKTCACGAKGTETFASGDLLPHAWDGGVTTTQPTCTEPGVMTYTCQNCDATKTAPVAALGHKLDETPAKEETCTEPGNSLYYTCQRCGKFFSDAGWQNEIEEGSWVIPAKDHDWDDGVVTQEPTCLEDGVRTFTCQRCQTTRTETEKAPGAHDFAPVSATPASTDKDGVLHLACTRCKEESTESFTFDAAAVQLTVGTADGSAKIHRGTIEVPVTLTGAAVNGMSMTVVYDETRLTLTGVSDGWTLSGSTVSTDSAVSAGTAVTLTFTVATDEGSFVNPGDAAISIGETTAQGADGALTAGQTAGKVVITKAGDINGDGEVDIFDVTRLRRFNLGLTTDVVPGSADVTGDGEVDVFDVTRLRRFNLGLIDKIY